jgi:phosphatidylglycerol:prolipoprotein diacylglycerol transferase
MQPVLFSIAGVPVESYGALLTLGLIAAAAVTLRGAQRAGESLVNAVDVVLGAMVGGVVGGRLAYTAIHWAYFVDHPGEAPQLWLGGLSWHGGLIGGAIGVGLIARFRSKQPAARWLNLLAPGAALGTTFGWLACFLSACACGREVFPGDALFALAIDSPDAYGGWAPRLPSQLFGAAWGLITFGVVLAMRQSRLRFPAFVALYSAGSFVVGFSRADAAVWIGGLNIEQAFDLLMLVAGLGWSGAVLSGRYRAHHTTRGGGESHVD